MKFRLYFAVMMSFVLTFFMSAWITFINVGHNAEFMSQWMTAWSAAWPVAAIIAFVSGPEIQKISRWLSERF
ncbi:DUF2798 domain-containing protein [Marinomonas transparens]|uniref:DUF2798 domain-containing protein n=1 Tax=Marinomonas transparens TaxID=2795388 RepID=A0A934JRY5_9GAMM|nr:DUF2798 domain-containing protein [Marinomonas transparens]MBJ7536315.1 DUF2798 domain-containing protein [Marinomonas transparens]